MKNLGFNIKTLLCFTKNLRLADSPLLNWAIQNSEEIMFVISWRDLVRRAGPFRKQFALECLSDLQASLKLRNQELIITCLPLQEFIGHEIKNSIQQIVIDEDVNHEESVQFENIKTICFAANIKLYSKIDSTLTDFQKTVPIFENKSASKNFTFTEFRKEIEKTLSVPAPVEMVDIFPRPMTCTQADYLTTVPALKQSLSDPKVLFKGGESAALKHLNAYFSKTENPINYKNTRNGMLRFEDSTKFSPWLSLGGISARTIYAELKSFENKYGSNESTYWILFELLWRDYFKYNSYLNKEKLFLRSGAKNIKTKILPHELEMDLFTKWKDGATGVDFIDANMLELKKTGWMSNRGRQNVASYLVKIQNVDWRLGASYFEEMLIDYDCASNWGNWSYLAGVGTDPRDRVFNVERQAETYDPEKLYVKKWLHKIAIRGTT
ncbi:MAG: DASH family cryptochrome [Bdellovibrionaceae bacterium]|nr:DASH family cryptochrome [Pseudobdellovibrionaceae bacterium]